MLNAISRTDTTIVWPSYRSVCPCEKHGLKATLSAQQRFRPRVAKVIDHPRDARLDAELVGEEPAEQMK
jgi:hypothetical protein